MINKKTIWATKTNWTMAFGLLQFLLQVPLILLHCCELLETHEVYTKIFSSFIKSVLSCIPSIISFTFTSHAILNSDIFNQTIKFNIIFIVLESTNDFKVQFFDYILSRPNLMFGNNMNSILNS